MARGRKKTFSCPDWCAANPELVTERQARLRERARRLSAAWHARQDKASLAEKARNNYQGETGWIKASLRRYRKRAKLLGVDFDLEFSDIRIPKKCPVLGIPIKTGGRRRAEIGNSPSVDRVDNRLGYVKGNVRVISHRANSIKSDATLDELKRICRYVRKSIVLKSSP